MAYFGVNKSLRSTCKQILALSVESAEFVRVVTLTITNKDCNNFPEDEFRTEVLNILCCLKSIVNKAKLVLHTKGKVKIPERSLLQP